MAEIVQGQIGPEVSYDVAFTGGALVASVTYKGAQAGASVQVNVSALDLIAKLEAHATNSLEKAALETIAALISRIP